MVDAEVDAKTALCFKAEVPMPSFSTSHRIDVSVSLRHGRRRLNGSSEAIIFGGDSGVGEAALLAEEVWTVGSASIALPSGAFY